jgi:cyclopropane fatty-acyl-phospholipid synthase-like methyltransferase
MSSVSYNSDFFNLHLEKSLSSARSVIPLVKEYIQPSSIIDMGCGNGTWLKAWQEHGVKTIWGVDGQYIKENELLINKEFFRSINLEEGYRSAQNYDLVTSLEVAEHIRPPFAAGFIQSLCELGDVILFSAAIPGQEGTYHFNEQYPDYWAHIFLENNFVPIDCIRQRIWNDEKISWWYRQNLLFFAKEDALSKYPKLQQAYAKTNGKIMNLVHPKLLEWKDDKLHNSKRTMNNPFRMAAYYGKKMIGK